MKPVIASKTNRRYRRKLPAKTKADAAQNKAIVNLQKKVKAITLSEPKYVQSGTNYASTFVNATPQFTLLNGITTGTTNITRLGSKLKWRYVDIRMLIRGGSPLDVPKAYRLYLVREDTALGSAIQASQLFSDSTPDALSQYNYTTRNVNHRFKIYKDSGPRVIGPNFIDYTSVNGSTAAHKSEHFLHWRVKLNFITDYSRGTAGTVADIDTNSLYLITTTDNSVASDLEFYVTWTAIGSEM